MLSTNFQNGKSNWFNDSSIENVKRTEYTDRPPLLVQPASLENKEVPSLKTQLEGGNSTGIHLLSKLFHTVIFKVLFIGTNTVDNALRC